MDGYAACFDLLARSGKVTVLTGAGVSTLSGIADFRGAGGFYTSGDLLYGVRREELFDIDFFKRRPEIFYRYAAEYLYPMLDKEPSIAHRTLAAMQKANLCGTLFTQNIDTLHGKAGGGAVVELHGTLGEHHCIECGSRRKTADVRALAEKGEVPRCPACGGLVKPRVVFYGETLDPGDLDRAFRECGECDVLLVLGSSLTVTPVANLPMAARLNGGKLVIVNAQETPCDREAAFRFDDIARFCGELQRRFRLEA